MGRTSTSLLFLKSCTTLVSSVSCTLRTLSFLTGTWPSSEPSNMVLTVIIVVCCPTLLYRTVPSRASRADVHSSGWHWLRQSLLESREPSSPRQAPRKIPSTSATLYVRSPSTFSLSSASSSRSRQSCLSAQRRHVSLPFTSLILPVMLTKTQLSRRHAQGVERSIWSNPRHPHPVPHLAFVARPRSVLRRYCERPREAERRKLVVPTRCSHRARRSRHVLRTWPRAFARRASFMSETIRDRWGWKSMISIRPYITHHLGLSNPGSWLTSLRFFSFFVLLHLGLVPIIFSFNPFFFQFYFIFLHLAGPKSLLIHTHSPFFKSTARCPDR
jgi:hypothetical protein